MFYIDAGLLEPVNIKKWIIYMPKNEADGDVQNLVTQMQSVGRKLGSTLAKEISL